MGYSCYPNGSIALSSGCTDIGCSANCVTSFLSTACFSVANPTASFGTGSVKYVCTNIHPLAEVSYLNYDLYNDSTCSFGANFWYSYSIKAGYCATTPGSTNSLYTNCNSPDFDPTTGKTVLNNYSSSTSCSGASTTESYSLLQCAPVLNGYAKVTCYGNGNGLETIVVNWLMFVILILFV